MREPRGRQRCAVRVARQQPDRHVGRTHYRAGLIGHGIGTAKRWWAYKERNAASVTCECKGIGTESKADGERQVAMQTLRQKSAIIAGAAKGVAFADEGERAWRMTITAQRVTGRVAVGGRVRY